MGGVGGSRLPFPQRGKVGQRRHVFDRQDGDQRPTAAREVGVGQHVAQVVDSGRAGLAGPHDVEPGLDDAPPVGDPVLFLGQCRAVVAQVTDREVVEVGTALRSAASA